MLPIQRAYLGLRIPDGLLPAVLQAQQQIRRKLASEQIRWATARELALILVSLGEQGDAGLEDIARRATAVCARFAPLEVSLQGYVGLPNAIQPRQVALGLQSGAQALAALQQDLLEALFPAGAPNEKASPLNVPIGRLRAETEASRTTVGQALRRAPSEPIATLTVAHLELLVSEAGDQGVGYRALRQIPLGF